MRILRNKIAYDGFFIETEKLKRKTEVIQQIITKLKKMIKTKL